MIDKKNKNNKILNTKSKYIFALKNSIFIIKIILSITLFYLFF